VENKEEKLISKIRWNKFENTIATSSWCPISA